ncbi:related to ribonucleoprotein [Pseudozyma flocculosa]|uniref:Related to ribonucleoprotein n=1 Tax=Pseudozyma flocculosa TaxID=84751 RepID=A0A5C3FCW9_9BASI|nr:related to ribonucleoprotein [Pseudozyma flocculosa]
MSTERSTTIFVEQTLHSYFSPFGDILEINIPKAEGGRARGFGFVVFSSPREVEDAVDNMHLNEILGRVVNVNIARPMKTSAGGRGPVWQDEDWIKQHALKPDTIGQDPSAAATAGSEDTNGAQP